MDESQQILQSLGLTDKEAAAYLALLKLGQATAYQIAQHTGIKKPTAYLVLDNLLKKEFVLKIPDAKKWRFLAKKPADVYEQEVNKISALRDALPMLTRLAAPTKNPDTDILSFDGLTNIKKGLWYGTKNIKEFDAFYGAATTASDALLKLILDWNEELAQKGARSRAIVPDHPSLKRFRKLDEKHNRIVRVVPYAAYPSDISIEIYHDFVRIFIIHRPQCIIIQNSDLAKVLRHIFEIVWSVSIE